MRRYDSYKDSCMQWLGEIPSHWTTVPLKRTVASPINCFIDGDWIESKVIESEGIRYLTTGNVGALNYKEQGNGFISEETFETLQCSEVFPGDLLISRLNEPIGRACIVPDLGYRIVVAVDNVIYRPNTALYDKRYLIYQMNCTPYTENANVIARGSTMPRISRTTLGQFKLAVPPKPEQQAIAAYLDKKCSDIDQAISTQQKRIKLLQELRQNIITQAVTRGINPDVPLKDSGVEWIGHIPNHWSLCKLKNALLSMQDGTHGTYQRVPSTFPLLSAKNVSEEGIIISDNESSISEEDYLSIVSNGFPKLNDIVLCCVGTIGRCCIYKESYPLAFQRSVTFLRVKDTFDRLYILYFLRCGLSKAQFDTLAKTSAQSGIYMGDLASMNIIYPPLHEQHAIAIYLDGECAKCDQMIAKAKQQITLLQELKQSIITEVVTGKRKVC